MVNLTIRLGKAGASPGGRQEPAAGTTPSTSKGPSIPPHLVDTDLPLVKGVGTVFPEDCAVNFVGVKARRRPGDKVHICVRCNFPIAVYGRLDPCEHVFCLTCAKLDSTCFLCEERVMQVQKMDVLEGIFICGAPGCLRSFLARADFDWHISEAHSQLFQLEQGRLSPERNLSVGNLLSDIQVHSHQGGQQQTDFAPPARQSSSTLQVLLPKKEEPQRKPPKGARQDPQSLLARPIPDLRLPDQFPHHRGGEQHMNHTNRDSGQDVDSQGKDQKQRRRHREWELQMSQGQIDNEREQVHDGETQRERWGDTASNHGSRKKDRDGDREARGPHPPSHPPPKDLLKQKEHLAQAQSIQQPVTLPPPPPYPPPNFSPAFLPQQEGKSFPPRFEVSRGFPSGMPLPSRPEYHENGPRLRHPASQIVMSPNPNPQDGFGQNGPLRSPLDGFGQSGHPRAMNGSSQDNFGQNRSIRPHFHPEYGPPMGMSPMGAPRYHEGHLPPPPPGPPPKRAKFSGHQGPSGPVPGDPMMDYGWGPGNPGNFGGPPGGHVYPGWMPPGNS